jgi:hypothetical protein
VYLCIYENTTHKHNSHTKCPPPNEFRLITAC